MTASAFVAGWIEQLAPAGGAHGRRALDLAMGGGRHARLLASYGFRTFGVDVRFDAVRGAIAAAAEEHLPIHGWCADLTTFPLPIAAFDVIVVARYLQRDLFPSLRAAVRPGGCVIYETFTIRQRALGTGPTSADHLLEPGELPAYFPDWQMVFSEEVASPEAVARMVARRPETSRFSSASARTAV